MLDLLSEQLADMASADPLYRPTNYWQTGLQPIADDLERHGFDNFREHGSANGFYVPAYGFKGMQSAHRRLAPLLGLAERFGGRRYVRALNRLVSGEQAAFEDYRLFRALDVRDGLPLDRVEESDLGGGQRFVIDGKRLGRSFLNYLRGLAFLKKHGSAREVNAVLEIGGGYGTLGEILLKARGEAGFYLNVDIPPVAAVSTWYLKSLLGDDAVFDYRLAGRANRIDLDEIRARYRAAIICPWQLPKVAGSFDLFVNFISFQEMEPAVVENYAAL